MRMILFKMFFFFVRSDFKENFNEVLPLTNVENENGNVQYDSVKSGMGHKL